MTSEGEPRIVPVAPGESIHRSRGGDGGMRSRRGVLRVSALAVFTVPGCSTGPREAADDTTGSSSPTRVSDTGTPTTETTTRGATTADTCETDPEASPTYDPTGRCPTYRLSDLIVYPDSGAGTTISISVVHLAEDRIVLEDTIEIPVDGPIKYEDPVAESGVHLITVEVAGGPSKSHRWDVPPGEAETDAYGVQVSVDPDGIVFSEIVT